MQVEPSDARVRLTRLARDLDQGQPPMLSRESHVGPDLLRQMAHIRASTRQFAGESPGLFADPTDLGLIATDRGRLRDLHSPAAVFLLPELGHDPEPDKSVMHVLREAFGRDCKLDSWIAAHGVHRAVAAHEDLDELSEPLTVPPPRAIREALLSGSLAHQLEFAQPHS